MKKLTALLVSAALALSLLAGCGGSKALSQVIADLLSGQYNNVTVEVDPDLTAALKKAAAAGDTQEEVLAALVENLNLSGGSITFNNLGDGQQGQHGVTLTFQPGSDPDAAARSAFTEWNRVFSSLPDDGSYTARVAMIEADGGYYIAVDVEVLKAGTPDKDEPEPKPDYTTSTENGVTTYTVYTAAGLQKWAEAAKADPSTNCTLGDNITLTGEWTPIGNDTSNAYTGTFDGGEHTIFGLDFSSSDEYAGLFGYIQGGTVQNLTLDSPTVSSDDFGSAGAVAGVNDGGTIENCHVVAGTVTNQIGSGIVGGVVGSNSGTVTACYATGTVTSGGLNTAGGVVGFNDYKVTACYWSGTVNGLDDSDQGIGKNYGTGDATKVDGSTVTWKTAFDGNESLTGLSRAAGGWYTSPVNEKTPPKLNWETP